MSTKNGTLRVSKVGSTTSTAVFLGDFTGDGGSTGGGDIFFEGDLRPGNSPAQVTYDNNVFFGSGSTLEIELGGVTPGLEHDKIIVDGSIALDGALNVSSHQFVHASSRQLVRHSRLGQPHGNVRHARSSHAHRLTHLEHRPTLHNRRLGRRRARPPRRLQPQRHRRRRRLRRVAQERRHAGRLQHLARQLRPNGRQRLGRVPSAPPLSAAVPEPSALALAVASVFAWMLLARRFGLAFSRRLRRPCYHVAHVRGDAATPGHRTRPIPRYGGALAACVQRAAPAGGGEAGAREARANAAGHRACPRGLSATRRRRPATATRGKAAGTFSRLPPKRCDGS